MTSLNKRAKFAGLARIALAATSAAVLFASQAAFATAAPGDNGTVKVHDSSTPVTDHQNDPQERLPVLPRRVRLRSVPSQ